MKSQKNTKLSLLKKYISHQRCYGTIELKEILYKTQLLEKFKYIFFETQFIFLEDLLIKVNLIRELDKN